MRVTNTQLSELEDIIEAKGLDITLFERIRGDNDGGFKYKFDYYQYVIRKGDGDNYTSIVFWINHREVLEHKQNWSITKQTFENWVNSLKSEIEAEKKLNLRTKSKNVKEFPPMIVKFSPKFNAIYNQAYYAEQAGLDEICGLGYRKSFEFLIKDYVVRNKPKEEIRSIKEMEIMPCIRQYVTDDRVKALAERVLWLGNDHAHYFKKWKTKSLEDLKRLIDISIEWIGAHEQLILIQQKISKVEKEMPRKAKKP